MWKLLTHNWNLKLTALVLAIVLWSHVRGEVNPLETGVFRVPLKTSLPRQMLITQGKVPLWVQVTLRAPRQTLRDLREVGSSPATTLPNPLSAPTITTLHNDDVSARLDFSGSGGNASTPLSGEVNVLVRAECHVPDGQVVSTEPGSIALRLDRAAHLVRPVQARMAATPNFAISVRLVAPTQVTLYGPSEALTRVARVVAPLALATATGEQKTTAALRILDDQGREVMGVVSEPPTARVQFVVSEQIVTKTLRLVPRLQGDTAPGWKVAQLSATPARVIVRGPRRALVRLQSLALALELDGATGDVQRKVRLVLPANVTLADEKTRSFVEVKARLAKSETPVVAPRETSPLEEATPLEPEPTNREPSNDSAAREPASRDEDGASLAQASRRSQAAPSAKLPPPAAD